MVPPARTGDAAGLLGGDGGLTLRRPSIRLRHPRVSGRVERGQGDETRRETLDRRSVGIP